MIFRARQFEFAFPRPVLLMGVLNVTPDSFSDGGRFVTLPAAMARAREMVSEGADLIDIGGESTRPGAAPISVAEEERRVIPVIEALAREIRVPISIDTMKPEVARAALKAGASIVNDVAAARDDAELWRVVAEMGAGYVAMHMQGQPATMQNAPHYADVVATVGAFFEERLSALAAVGVRAEQVVLDVGIGFGKAVEHNLQLLAQLDSFKRYQRPLLLGVSRKSFIASVAGPATVEERLPGSLAGACWGTALGAEIIRTHDVAATRQAVKLTMALAAHRA